MKKKRNRIVLIVVIVCLITLPISMRFVWEFSAKRSLNVLILDKTVLNSKSQEHLSFNWLLNYNNYVKPDEMYYLPEKDYFGFFPDGEGKYSINDLDSRSSEELDFLFYQSDVNERNSFFWKYYNPLIEKILKDYYIDLNYT